MGIIPNFIDLGSYKDPDEFLTEKGPAAFEEKIKGSIPFLDHILNDLAPRKDAHDTESKKKQGNPSGTQQGKWVTQTRLG